MEVYLDQNKWIELARIIYGKNNFVTDAVGTLETPKMGNIIAIGLSTKSWERELRHPCPRTLNQLENYLEMPF